MVFIVYITIIPIVTMNSFEDFTVIIGLLAVLMEGFSYAKEFLRKLIR